ncbi:alpha/beta hydrolase [Ornithobacterium rhinotracheale]|uniref:alpha/beta hydrolase n=1 Tax=Ornithobacterium rhinotracheale TaxID=28251 RepID=UPI00129CF404|nr:alpha/beta hydrolase [Ornithobacterium rhinotracheale]MRI64117.1 alpha/beta hydrolase [Ornithobacterium rhinotracheale]
MKLYCISGLGANQKAFKFLKFPDGIEPIFIEWLIPEKCETLAHYTQRMAKNIDTSEKFALLGLSFGGIIVQEMNRFLSPEKTILISTVKNHSELPKWMRWGGKLHADRLIPMRFFTSDSFLSYTFFRKLYDRKLPEIKEYFTHRDPYYLKWSIHQIIRWEPEDLIVKNLYHMHGDKDIVFPIKNIKNADIIHSGTHIMVMQQAKKVNLLLQKYFAPEKR